MYIYTFNGKRSRKQNKNEYVYNIIHKLKRQKGYQTNRASQDSHTRARSNCNWQTTIEWLQAEAELEKNRAAGTWLMHYVVASTAPQWHCFTGLKNSINGKELRGQYRQRQVQKKKKQRENTERERVEKRARWIHEHTEK